MEQTPRKKAGLIGLIAAVILIAVLVIVIGSVCTCTCACGSCLACGKILDAQASAKPNVIAEPDPTAAPVVTEAPVTPEPAPTEEPATPEPTPSPTLAPVSLGEQTPLKTASPITDEPGPSVWVRPKRVQLKNDGTDTVTVLVLMNGSDLESEYHEATDDLTEMLRASKSERVNILVETVGTKQWNPRYGISSQRSQRYRIAANGLTLVDDSLGQLDTTIPSTLSDFIRWGVKNYPADRYILLLWDHGAGPVYGFGYDEFQPSTSTLTLDEIQIALRDGGVYFDLIGMDCCLMSSIEVCCALYDFCDYTLLSEDFEPGCGWSHTGWLSALAKNPAIKTPDLAKIAIDDTIRAAEPTVLKDGGATLALIDESYLSLLFPAWVEFAYANETTLLGANYSQLRESTGRAHPKLSRAVGGWLVGNGHTLEDYCITDVLSLAANIPSPQSDALAATLDRAIVYYRATSDERTLTGLSVTLPYGDETLYNEMRRVFRNAGFDEDYLAWLKKFVSVKTPGNAHYDFGDWQGWSDYIGGYDWSKWTNALEEAGDWAEGWINDLDFGDFDEVLGWLFDD